MIDFLVEVLIPAVLVIPGAYFRWLISGRKVKFWDYLRSGNEYRNGVVGVLALFLLIGLLNIIF